MDVNRTDPASLILNPPFPEPPQLRRSCIGWQSIAWLGFQYEAGDDAGRRLARAVLPGATTTRVGGEAKR